MPVKRGKLQHRSIAGAQTERQSVSRTDDTVIPITAHFVKFRDVSIVTNDAVEVKRPSSCDLDVGSTQSQR